MTITNIIDQLKRDEDIKLKPYRDTKGKLTIGIGRNLDDVGISHGESEFLLCNDVARAKQSLLARLPWVNAMDDVRQSVLVNMCFNMGIDRLLEFRRTLGLIQLGQYANAAVEMLDSEWATEVGDRAKRLSKQMATGLWQ